MTRTNCWIVFCLGAMFLATGCSNNNPLGRKAVTGKVTVDGQPVPHGSVTFEPLQAKGVGSGAVITNGSYSIKEEEGLPPGKYRVSLTATEGEPFKSSPGKMPGDEEMPAQKSLIPGDWKADDIEVKDQGPSVFNFAVVTKK